MQGDNLLNSTGVTLKGDEVICQGHDIKLDSVERRDADNPSSTWRSLVHSQRDPLVANYGKDL